MQHPLDSVEAIALEALKDIHGYVRSFNANRVNWIKIRLVCYVYCSATIRLEPSMLSANPYKVRNCWFGNILDDRDDKLKVITDELARAGCTTSMHTVWTEEEWRSLLDCLHLVAPDVGDDPFALHASQR